MQAQELQSLFPLKTLQYEAFKNKINFHNLNTCVVYIFLKNQDDLNENNVNDKGSHPCLFNSEFLALL